MNTQISCATESAGCGVDLTGFNQPLYNRQLAVRHTFFNYTIITYLINLSNGLILHVKFICPNFGESTPSYAEHDVFSVRCRASKPHAISLRLKTYEANFSKRLRSHRRNGEDFAGFFVEDDGHVFVAGVEREEADFGFVEGFGG
jgi:hypothetical protein